MKTPGKKKPSKPARQSRFVEDGTAGPPFKLVKKSTKKAPSKRKG